MQPVDQRGPADEDPAWPSVAAAAFKKAPSDDVTAVLESLAAVGLAVEVTAQDTAERRWRAAR